MSNAKSAGRTDEIIRLPDSLISIGEKAFCNCKSLETVEFGMGLKTIGYGAFSFCKKLDDYLYLPYGLENIEGSAFYDCDSLETVKLPKTLKNLGSKAFSMCDRLYDINIPDSVTRIGSQVLYQSACYNSSSNWRGDAFYIGANLLEAKKSISGSCAPSNGIKRIAEGAFENCDYLTEVILPDSLQIIGASAFESCDKLQSITIPSGVTTIGDQAFYECKAATDIQFSDSVVYLGQDVFTKTGYYNNAENWENDAFYMGDYLVSCKPSLSGAFQVRQGTKTIVNGAMKGLTNLTELTLPDTLTTIGDEAVAGCTALTKVTISDGVTTIGEKAFYDCSALKTVYLGKEVSQIGAGAFGQCSNLESITVHSENGCFYFCENITSLHLPDSLEVLGDAAFYGCEKITSLSLGRELTTIGSAAFSGCESLVDLTIPDKVHTIGNSAFYECTSLQQVDLGQVEKIEYSAFEACRSLTEIYIPASVTELGNNVFSYCDSMERMTVSPENTDYHSQDNCIINTRGKYLAFGCKNSIIPADGSVISIDGYAFAGCTGLKSIVVPDQVTRICAYAFYNCSGLEYMQLPFVGGESEYDNYIGFIFGGGPLQNGQFVPASLKRVVITGGTKVGDSGFSDCSRLQEIVLPETMAHTLP